MRWIISLSAVAALCLGAAGNVAVAQHYHHHGSYWNSGHYDYHPAHYDVHRGHLDFTPAITTSIGGRTFRSAGRISIKEDTATERRGCLRS